jgi:hypothetical protein
MDVDVIGAAGPGDVPACLESVDHDPLPGLSRAALAAAQRAHAALRRGSRAVRAEISPVIASSLRSSAALDACPAMTSAARISAGSGPPGAHWSCTAPEPGSQRIGPHLG